MTPKLISGCPNLAVGEARMMSHIRANSHPPPSCRFDQLDAGLAETTAFTHSKATDCSDNWFPSLSYTCPILQKAVPVDICNCVWLNTRAQCRSKLNRVLTNFVLHLLDIRSSCVCNPRISLELTPYEIVALPAKAFGEPVSTIAPTLPSASAFKSASFSSLNSGVQSAFNALGLLRVIRDTPGSGCDVRMCSYCWVELDMDRMLLARRRTRWLGVGRASLEEPITAKERMMLRDIMGCQKVNRRWD